MMNDSIDSDKYYTTKYKDYFLLLNKNKYPPSIFKVNKKTNQIIDNALEKGQKYISVYLDHINLTPLHKPFPFSEETILNYAKNKLNKMFDDYDLLIKEIHEFENDKFKLLLVIDLWTKKHSKKKTEIKLKNLEQSVQYLENIAKTIFSTSRRWRVYE